MPSRRAFFLPVGDEQCFCLYSPADKGTIKGGVVYIHPFAEELNKTRRMVALQVRLLVKAGYSVLQIDLRGCGDSSGDFGEATWDKWLDDVSNAIDWLREETSAPLWVWGLRSGALLAAETVLRQKHSINCLFWQPFANGQLALQQFMRLGAVADLLAEDGKGRLAAMKAELQAGHAIEVAGYCLAPALADGLANSTLNAPPVSMHESKSAGLRLIWVDIVSREIASISPWTVGILEQWQSAGYETHHRSVIGPAFWQAAEIETVPDLLSATLQALDKSA